jgi:hypothetical protein
MKGPKVFRLIKMLEDYIVKEEELEEGYMTLLITPLNDLIDAEKRVLENLEELKPRLQQPYLSILELISSDTYMHAQVLQHMRGVIELIAEQERTHAKIMKVIAEELKKHGRS